MRGPVADNGHLTSSSTANGSTEDATTELSRLMLEGWTMMAETCPRGDCYIPLARSREGQLYCCGCRSNIAAVDDVDAQAPSNGNVSAPAELSEEQSADESNTPPDTDDGANSVVAIRGGADMGSELAVSTALGEKLLQGWTLLNTTCRVCNTPLLRAQSGTLLCVQCATDGAAAAASGTPASTPALPAPQTRHSLPPPRDNRAETIMPAPPADPSNQERHLESGERRRTTHHTMDDATYLELVRSEEAVVDAMRSLRIALAARRDVDAMARIIRALGDAGTTIEALRSSRKSLGDIM